MPLLPFIMYLLFTSITHCLYLLLPHASFTFGMFYITIFILFLSCVMASSCQIVYNSIQIKILFCTCNCIGLGKKIRPLLDKNND